MKGREEFRLVSPIFRQNIYVGAFDELKPDQSPINFFDPNISKFPLVEHVQFLELTLDAGDCVYVPAYYYI